MWRRRCSRNCYKTGLFHSTLKLQPVQVKQTRTSEWPFTAWHLLLRKRIACRVITHSPDVSSVSKSVSSSDCNFCFEIPSDRDQHVEGYRWGCTNRPKGEFQNRSLHQNTVSKSTFTINIHQYYIFLKCSRSPHTWHEGGKNGKNDLTLSWKHILFIFSLFRNIKMCLFI